MSRVAVEYQLERVPVESLVPYAKNSRTHKAAQIEQLAAAIRRFGFTNPVLVDEGGGIIAGHGRVMAAQSLGMSTVPVMRLVGLSDDERRALVIADNKLAENSGWNRDLLTSELGELSAAGFDMGLLGFSEKDLQTMLPRNPRDGLTHPDEAPAAPAESDCVSRRSDVWTLGAHRVICGDATDAAVWQAVMGDDLADVCWCDPPYNVGYEAKAGKIQNDDLSDRAFFSLVAGLMGACYRVMKMGAAIYVAHADTEGLNFRRAFSEAGFKLAGCLVWRKDCLVLGRSDYQWMHEPILYGWKPGAAHKWFGGRKQTTIVEYGAEGPVRQRPDGTWVIEVGDTVLVVDGAASLEILPSSLAFHERPKRSADHPTMKPVGLVERQLQSSARAGDCVIDCCAGSGSTLIAAERNGMRARVVELEPRFVDVIVRRWQDFTGLVAVRQADGLSFKEASQRVKSCEEESHSPPT